MATTLRIRLILVGRTDRGYVDEGMSDYLGRIGRMAAVETIIVPEERSGEAAHRQRAEGERLLAALKPEERVVVLDERGKALGSTDFGAKLRAWRDQGGRQVAFVVGGAYGLSDDVRKRADLLLSLSAMTFPHQLVRVILAEQIYRALMILNGKPYHH